MAIIMTIIWMFFWSIQVILLIYLLLPSLFLLLHSVNTKGTKLLEKKYPVIYEKDFDFAAIITAHQDIRFLPPLIDSFLRQEYANFTVYVIADDCDISSLQSTDARIIILRPEKALNAKIQSIKYAVNHFVRQHDALVVFDSDNLVHPSYLKNLNEYFRRGFQAVQTHMLSKNSDTIFAKLDSIGHIYNTFVERQSRMELGLSSSILGLGIAVKTNLYRQVMYKDALGGFDKKLQADIIRAIPQLAFAEDAIVYDEKVKDGKTLETQRTRWLYTYFKYFPINWQLLVDGIKRRNFNQGFFAFATLRPPLFITIGLFIICTLIWLFLNLAISIAWMVVLIVYVISFVLIILTQSRQKGMYKALLYIPLIILRQISALMKIKKASSNFLKTEHVEIIYIEELLKK
jgi:cellulose synthase/poly-beta-1,6-N-acetylglucosamine synthase-like glycosyltransferase